MNKVCTLKVRCTATKSSDDSLYFARSTIGLAGVHFLASFLDLFKDSVIAKGVLSDDFGSLVLEGDVERLDAWDTVSNEPRASGSR
jgi:hypothetical protein